MTYKEIYKQAIDKWGSYAQFQMAMEECAELIVACSHVMRDREDIDAIERWIEEVVDAENMVNQMKYLISLNENWTKSYRSWKRYKMKRVEKLLLEER